MHRMNTKQHQNSVIDDCTPQLDEDKREKYLTVTNKPADERKHRLLQKEINCCDKATD